MYCHTRILSDGMTYCTEEYKSCYFLIGKMVLCSDYKYSKPIEHYAIFTAYFYLSFRFIHCFVAGRSTGNSMLRLKILFGFPRYSDCI